jgi:hypothetical protein
LLGLSPRGPLELGEFVTLGLDPFSELEVFFISRGNEAILLRDRRQKVVRKKYN